MRIALRRRGNQLDRSIVVSARTSTTHSRRSKRGGLMSFYANTNRVLERRSLGSASKVAGDPAKTDDNTRRVAVNFGEESDTSIAVLTLDDFGGRSDALGG